MRSRIGRRILAGYLAVSLVLAVALAGLAAAGNWIAEVARGMDRADRHATHLAATWALLERRLFYVLQRAVDPTAAPSAAQALTSGVLATHLDRLPDTVEGSEEQRRRWAARLRTLTASCEDAVQALQQAARANPARPLRTLLSCHRDLRGLLDEQLDRLQATARAKAAQLDAWEGAPWLPGFLRNLARNSQRARRLNQAVANTLRFEALWWAQLSAALQPLLDPGLRGPTARPEAAVALLRPVEELEGLPDVQAVARALRITAMEAAAQTLPPTAQGAARALVGAADPVVRQLESLRPLLEVERDRALADVELVNGSVLSFVQTAAAAAVAGLLVGFVALVALTRTMTRSLEELRDAMEQVGRGQLRVRVDVGSRRDETADMARVFNRMVDELRESREKLQAYQVELQKLVAERTQALQEAQAQLVQAEKLSAVGELVAKVAHELNNPLTSVLGYAQLLESDPQLSEELREYAAVVVREADRARQIVQSLLTFGRPQPVERETLDVNQVVRRTVELPQWKSGQVEVTTHLHPEPLWVLGNAVQLQQVFANIVQNAVQAMRHGPGELVVTTGRVGDRAVVEFADTGPGIPPEHLGRIFDPFFTTKGVGEGTGLGLSISYGIVRDHGGVLRARNRPEGGACFTVELPLCEPPGVRAADPAPPPPRPPGPSE